MLESLIGVVEKTEFGAKLVFEVNVPEDLRLPVAGEDLLEIAGALIEASKQVGFNVPLVVRLEGTEVEEGRKMLAECDIDIITANDLTDAAQKVVAAVKDVKG